MIRSLSFDQSAATKVVPWWPKCEAWKDRTSFTFSPGLTLVCGPNGAGKTALFTLLSRLLFAEQGGKSTLTFHSVHDAAEYPLDKIHLDHDGQGIWHLDLGHTPGLMGGGFDDDFFMEGVAGLQRNRISAGQGTMVRLNSLLKAANEVRAPGMETRGQYVKVPERLRVFLAGQGEKGPPTFLFDEPDRNLDANSEASLWIALARMALKCQIIVISHSPLPLLQLPDENILEAVPGYKKKAIARLRFFLDGKASVVASPVATPAK